MSQDSLFDNRDFLDVTELADYLRCSTKAIYAAVGSQGLPVKKMGVKMIFSKDQVKQWFEASVERGNHYANTSERKITGKMARGWQTTQPNFS